MQGPGLLINRYKWFLYPQQPAMINHGGYSIQQVLIDSPPDPERQGYSQHPGDLRIICLVYIFSPFPVIIINTVTHLWK